MATKQQHFEVKLKRSAAGWPETQVRTLTSLGLLRFGRSVFLKDTPAVRGMLYKVVHVVDVITHAGEAPLSNRGKRREQAKKAAPKAAKAPRAKKAPKAAAEA